MAELQIDPDRGVRFDPDDAFLVEFIAARYEGSDSPTYATPEFRRRVRARLAEGTDLSTEALGRAADDVSDDMVSEESNVIARPLLPAHVMTVIGSRGPAPDSMRGVVRVFGAVLAFVPRRIADEELGDALEVIVALRFTGWRLWAKVASTILWVLVNAVREGAAAGLGKKKGGG